MHLKTCRNLSHFNVRSASRFTPLNVTQSARPSADNCQVRTALYEITRPCSLQSSQWTPMPRPLLPSTCANGRPATLRLSLLLAELTSKPLWLAPHAIILGLICRPHRCASFEVRPCPSVSDVPPSTVRLVTFLSLSFMDSNECCDHFQDRATRHHDRGPASRDHNNQPPHGVHSA